MRLLNEPPSTQLQIIKTQIDLLSNGVNVRQFPAKEKRDKIASRVRDGYFSLDTDGWLSVKESVLFCHLDRRSRYNQTIERRIDSLTN
jgi:hypothetical protein